MFGEKAANLWQFIGIIAVLLSAQVALLAVSGGRDLSAPIIVVLALFVICEVALSWALLDAIQKSRERVLLFLQLPVALSLSVGLALALVFVVNLAFFHLDFSVFVVAGFLQFTVRLGLATLV